MTEIERKARVEFLRTEAEFTHEFHIAADQIEADGKRIEALEAENERLREILREVTPPVYFGESEQNKAWWAKARAALGETK